MAVWGLIVGWPRGSVGGWWVRVGVEVVSVGGVGGGVVCGWCGGGLAWGCECWWGVASWGCGGGGCVLGVLGVVGCCVVGVGGGGCGGVVGCVGVWVVGHDPPA